MPNQYLDSADTNEEFRRSLDLIEAILANKFPQISTKEILEIWDLKIADIKKTRFYQESSIESKFVTSILRRYFKVYLIK